VLGGRPDLGTRKPTGRAELVENGTEKKSNDSRAE
jgi:hypothetical protein